MIEIRKCADTITTWAELRDAVHAGSSPLNVGDEIDIVLKTGEKVTLVCELVKDGHATFFTKDLLEDTHVMDDGWITGWKKRLGTMDGYLEKLFRLLPDDLQAAICGEKLRLLREREVFGENRYGKPENCEQLPRYQEPENRVKRLSGAPFPYWLASPDASDSAAFCSVTSGGSSYYYYASYGGGVCFGLCV
nr:MAG TPA: hypothetical protein [Caudoviricetes sp.]